MLNELISEILKSGADFVRTVDISALPDTENQGYPYAILIGMVLSREYVRRLSEEGPVDYSEFCEKESKTDRLAEQVADGIAAKGYDAFAQSENNLNRHGLYNEAEKRTPFPHKKIALLSGLGWIGKNNLLVTENYGCAVSVCTVLTNLPLPSKRQEVLQPKCKDCVVCAKICPVGAIHDRVWAPDIDRDTIVDVYRCAQCLKCLALCPWTQKYINSRDEP